MSFNSFSCVIALARTFFIPRWTKVTRVGTLVTHLGAFCFSLLSYMFLTDIPAVELMIKMKMTLIVEECERNSLIYFNQSEN